MKGKIGSGFALGWIAALGLIVAGFIGLDAWMGKPAAVLPSAPQTVAAPVPSTPVAETPPTPVQTLPAQTTSTVMPAASVSLSGSPSDQPVTLADLDRLASAVHLRDPSFGAGKDVWASQLPVAESLLQRPCDCDQRNWLKHYVETANDAMTGSGDYVRSIQLLATLRRNDQDLTQSSPSSR